MMTTSQRDEAMAGAGRGPHNVIIKADKFSRKTNS